MATQLQKAERFRALHGRDTGFVIPNPWDIGSACLLAGLGFEALATTSGGFASSVGRKDGDITREQAIRHCRELSAATNLPVSADLENCFADDPWEAAKTIALAAEAGVVGGSIEDYGGNATPRIYDFSLAVERVHAAVETAKSLNCPFTLTARAENFVRGRTDLDDTIRRLQAFEAAGADVLFAPGLTTLDQVRMVAGALSKPINVVGVAVANATAAELYAAGAKRISVAGALARVAMTALLHSAKQLHEGRFDWSAGLASSKEITTLFDTARSAKDQGLAM
jgi:2-methylisocitrate lyase-like PEP mutase family enzyme